METAPKHSKSVTAANLQLLFLVCLPSSFICLQVKTSLLLIIPLESAATTRKHGEIPEMAGFGANYQVINKKVTAHSAGLLKTKADTKCEHLLVEGSPLGRKITETST